MGGNPDIKSNSMLLCYSGSKKKKEKLDLFPCFFIQRKFIAINVLDVS